jgi:hypothetical protein
MRRTIENFHELKRRADYIVNYPFVFPHQCRNSAQAFAAAAAIRDAFGDTTLAKELHARGVKHLKNEIIRPHQPGGREIINNAKQSGNWSEAIRKFLVEPAFDPDVCDYYLNDIQTLDPKKDEIPPEVQALIAGYLVKKLAPTAQAITPKLGMN